MVILQKIMYSFAEKDYRFKAIFSIQIEFLKSAVFSSIFANFTKVQHL